MSRTRHALRRFYESAEIPPEAHPPGQEQQPARVTPHGHELDVPHSTVLPTEHLPDAVKHISHHIKKAGGSPYLVGGTVRDQLAGKPSKDYDFEVYGLPKEHLQRALSGIPNASFSKEEVGQGFSVFKINYGGEDFDIAMPRRERETGPSHKDVEVVHDPTMRMSEATERRDFTINSMSWDPITGKVYDSRGGIEDLKNRRLRATNPEVVGKDPLRILRGAQFASRFGLTPDDETLSQMQANAHKLSTEPKTRVGGEWLKLMLKGKDPAAGLEMLRQTGALEHLHPHLHLQSSEHHPEGDAIWEHTKNAVHHASALTNHIEDPKSRFAVRMAAALHNISKPVNQDGNHAAQSAKMISKLIPKEFEFEGKKGDKFKRAALAKKVAALVGEHETPGMLLNQIGGMTDADVRRLANRLSKAGASIHELVPLAHANHSAKFGRDHQEFEAGSALHDAADRLGVLHGAQPRLITGDDLKRLGVAPGEQFGRLLSQLYDMQLDGKITSHDDGIQAALALLGRGNVGESICRTARVLFGS